jgi:hypothetical protein
LISISFGIPLSEVENRPITEYRLMLFTVMNTVALNLGGEFKYQTPEEEVDEARNELEYFKKKGFFRG